MNMLLLQKARGVVTKNSPTIITGMAVVGFVGTVVLAVKATPKALALIEEAEQKKWQDKYWEGDNHTKKPTLCLPLEPLELIQTTWKAYLPAAVTGLLTLSCIIGANSINLRRNAALISLYGLSEAALKEYQAKVIETLGKGKEKKVRDEISKDKILANPVSDKELLLTGKGESLCYDALSGRYFKSDIESIRQALNKLSRDLMSEMFIDLNHVYSELGLKGTKIGETIGWHVDDGLIEPDFSSQLTENGTPCLVLDYVTEPRFNHNYY